MGAAFHSQSHIIFTPALIACRKFTANLFSQSLAFAALGQKPPSTEHSRTLVKRRTAKRARLIRDRLGDMPIWKIDAG